MQHIKLLFLYTFFFLISLSSIAQVEWSTNNKKAIKAFNEGDAAFRLQNYQEAEQSFLRAISIDPGFYEAHVLLAELYETTHQDSNAVMLYEKAISLDADKYPAAYFFLAGIEYRNGWYLGAEAHYLAYLQYPSNDPANKQKAEKHILNCRFAQKAMENPVPFEPVNLGMDVNTPRDEYFPCLTADNETLLFTRLLVDKNSFTGKQEDFFVSRKNGDEWETAINIGLPINTKYNEGAPSLSADGNTLIFTACESVAGYGNNRQGFGRCDLFISQRKGLSWSTPRNIGKPVSSRYWESQPSISADGKTLYFVSNRDSDYDIWVTRQDDKGRWSLPEMLGPNINTSGYEGSVFIHPDNQTLYFSSDGHVGMGGMDIFYSRLDSAGNWGEPTNLGYPINTWKDENSVVISADGELAMFASDRKDGFGGLDLYAFELYKEARPLFVTYLKGTVFDDETSKKLRAAFELTDLETGNVSVTSYSNEETGEFLVALPTDRDYALTVSRPGYLFYSENFNLEGVHSQTDPFIKDIPLKPIKTGESVVLRNIFYETDKYELKEKSRVEMQKLIDLMQQNPELRIEISGHTDNVGMDEYNKVLSRNRAKSVYDYLVENGIDQSRLTYEGYGKTKPVDTNETEEGRANNRRTEFKVL
ncbi:MAG: PD40 domain-containing protein [Bacteroidales bacterium]|nr:PD40 domain-containing protein [Bacteroidales bacterium]